MEKNRKIVIYIGIPASGKTTAAKEFLRNNPDWVRVSRDDFRLMLRNEQMCEPKIEDLVTQLVNGAINKALVRKQNVIVDATNVREKYINEFIEEYKYSADIDYRVFDISLDKAIERDNNRQMKVGTEVIKRMYDNYKILIDSFHFQPVKKIANRPHITPNFESKLPDAVIFDIDGTLALMGNRGAFDWDKVDRDNVNKIVAEQIDFHMSLGRQILIVSGRDEVCMKMTEDWLNFYGIHFDHIFMRPKDDYRKDTIIKKEIYENEIKDKYNVLAVYDDRLSVITDTWYNLGLFVFNVNQGMIEF